MVPEASFRASPGEPKILDWQSLSNPPYTVRVTDRKPEYGRLSARVAFEPELTQGATCSYMLTEECPTDTYKLWCTTEEMNKLKLKGEEEEFFGWTISRPAKRLSIRVFFPKDYRPTEPHLKVRFASVSGLPSVRYQSEERSRLGSPTLEGPTAGHFQFYQEIEYPMINLIYLISWLPKVRDSVG
jgi:hypothetical protein